MAELKTQKTSASVSKFINSVADAKQRKDSKMLLRIFRDVVDERPAIWGTSIVGFGSYHYKSERSAQEGDWPLTGFSPRKGNMTVYIMPGFKKYKTLLKKLGPHKTSVSCLYFKKLDQLHIPTLKEIIRKSVVEMKARYHG